MRDELRVICATIAFGMGINKPDVRFVVHHSLPKSLEGYLQETGRAGRDGQNAKCYLYYTWGDKGKIDAMIERGDGDDATKAGQRHNLMQLIGYAEDELECRRKMLLGLFKEHFTKQMYEGTCDNCRRGAASEARRLRPREGRPPARARGAHAADAHDGREPRGRRAELAKRLTDRRATALRQLKKTEIERILKAMIGKRHLSEELEINQNYGGVTAYLGTGDAAHTLHGQGARPLRLQFPAAAQPAKGRVPVERGGDDEQSSEAKRLVQQLTDLLLKARKEHYPQQANLHTLFDAGQAKRVADFLPASKKQLSQLSGWGKVKANKMGVWVLEMVEKFVADNPSHLAEAFAKNQAEAAKDNKEVDPDFEGAGASSQWRQKKQRKMPASVGAALAAAAAARDTGGMSRHFPPQPPPPNGGRPSSSSSQPGFSQAAPSVDV